MLLPTMGPWEAYGKLTKPLPWISLPVFQSVRVPAMGSGSVSRADLPEPGDEREGDYTRRQLVQMESRFCERMAKAVKDGRERMPERDSHLQILAATAAGVSGPDRSDNITPNLELAASALRRALIDRLRGPH